MSTKLRKYKIRNSCRLCDSKKIKKILNLPKVPPGEQLRKNYKHDFVEVPIDIYKCQKCHHFQIINIPNDNLMWNDEYTFVPSLNKNINKHFLKTVKYISNKFKPKIKRAFEIGSNDGSFLKLIKNQFNCDVIGIDPSKLPRQIAKRNGIKTINKFFNFKKSHNIKKKFGKFDLIIANNVFAHTDDLNNMLKGIDNLLTRDGIFTFEISYLLDVLKKRLIGTIIHEHLSIHSIISLKKFFNKFKMELIDIRHDPNIQGGALVGFVKRKQIKKNNISIRVEKFEKKEKEFGLNNNSIFEWYEDYFYKKINSFLKKIKTQLRNKKIVCCGASRPLPLILKLLQIEKKVEFVLDNNKFKFNKFLPIENIQIVDFNKHIFSKEKIYLISGWVHTNKIIKNIKKISKYKNKFITIFPQYKIISK